MTTSAVAADDPVAALRIATVRLTGTLRHKWTIFVPLAWYSRLPRATPKQRRSWQIAGEGYGIHWPDIDEHLNTEALLRGTPSPHVAAGKT